MLDIKLLYEEDAHAVRDFVLDITNNEFGLDFEPHEQPDLYNLEKCYAEGVFWIARYNGIIAGTIGLQKLNSNVAIVRHLYVKTEHRGTDDKIAQQLFKRMLMYAKVSNFKHIFLGTPEIAVASHQFFLRNGFSEMTDRTLFPSGYRYPDRNSKVFHMPIHF